MGKYFITGATGTVGREVVHALLEKGHQVVAASRHVDKARELFGDKVQAVHFDYEDHGTFGQVAGSDGVFLLGPPLDLRLFQLLEPFVDHLDGHGPSRLVYLSANGMDKLDTLPMHKDMEAKLRDSRLDWRIARPGFFAQNFNNYERETIEQQKVLFQPAGNGQTAFVSTRDIGAAVAALLVEDQYRHQAFPLTGPEDLGYSDAAALLSDVLGEPIHYANPDPETFKHVLAENGAPPFVADYMIQVYGTIRKGEASGTTPHVEQLTGRKPETLREVLERDFG